MLYREGEKELREAVARALGEGRVKEDYGRWFFYDDSRALIGSPELVERFLVELSNLVFKSLKKGGVVQIRQFGTFHVKKTPSGIGSGVLAGKLLPARKRVVFGSDLGRMGAGGLGGEETEPEII